MRPNIPTILRLRWTLLWLTGMPILARYTFYYGDKTYAQAMFTNYIKASQICRRLNCFKRNSMPKPVSPMQRGGH